jgi:hypothetical protein
MPERRREKEFCEAAQQREKNYYANYYEGDAPDLGDL